MFEVSFRPAVAADAAAVTRIFLTSFKHFIPTVTLAHSDEDVSEWIPNVLLKTADVRVAERDGEIVGMMAMARHDNSGWINQLYLDPSVVRRGIGTQFVEQAKVTLGAPIRLYAFQVNTNACRFYERNGFQAITFGDGSGNQEKSPDVLYEWSGDPQTAGTSAEETRQV